MVVTINEHSGMREILSLYRRYLQGTIICIGDSVMWCKVVWSEPALFEFVPSKMALKA